MVTVTCGKLSLEHVLEKIIINLIYLQTTAFLFI